MSSWVSALEQLAALDPADFDPGDLSDDHLRSLIPLAQVAINRLSALQARAVAAAEVRQVHTSDGMASMKSWLTGHCRLSGREATCLVRDGRRLRELPTLAAAYAVGAVTPAHVGVMTGAITPARIAKAAEQGIDLDRTIRSSPEQRSPWGRRTPRRPCAGGSPGSTPTAPWTTRRVCPGHSG